MHWIVNTSLKRELGYDALLYELEKQGVSYTLCRKPPFVDYLIGMEDEFDTNGNNIPIMLDYIEGPVFVTGTTSMKEVSLKHGWAPGYIDAPGQEECIQHWHDNMLNHRCQIEEIQKMDPSFNTFFIRPDADSKSFSGTVMKKEDFESWREQLLSIDSYTTIPKDTKIIVSPMRDIWAEYRCIMLHGKYLTGSRYKTGTRVEYSPEVGERFIKFAEEMCEIWNPRDLITLDLADTPDGIKIIETNSVSSSGFYAIDMNKFVGGITYDLIR